MKNSFALLAFAAGLGQVTATFGKFHNANPYSCPKNSDNKCDERQKGGWSWDGLDNGKFDRYDGWDFKGWSCENDFSKRNPLAKRTFGGKVISGSCGPDKESSPSFGCSGGSCGDSGADKFSISHFDITPEFDCRMEFHYDMPDGSTCKHSADCSSHGTTVRNTQCGGAKKVHFVYPKQDKPKKTCHVGVHKVHFDCDKPVSTPVIVPSSTACNGRNCGGCKGPYCQPTSVPVPTTTAGEDCKGYDCVPGETTTAPGEETTTAPGEETTAPCKGYDCVPGEETSSDVIPTTTAPGEETTTAPGEETTTVPGEETTTAPGPETTPCKGYDCVPEEETTVPGETSTAPGEETSTSDELPSTTGPAEETTSVPSETITAPGEETTAPCEGYDCVPEEETTVAGETTTSNSVPSTTGPAVESTTSDELPSTTGPAEQTVPGETTTAPGEETPIVTTYDSLSTIFTTSLHTIISCAPEVPDCPATSGQVVVTTVIVPVSTTICPVTETIVPKPTGPTGPGEDVPATTSSAEEPEQSDEPDEPLPCPEVVPSCLNTFLYMVEQCKDNTDAGCYCPNQDYVNAIFECLYAHGESDDVVSEAISFFQGICAPYVGENPGIATGADSITTIITVTGTPIVTSAHYTTVLVATTITEPAVSEGTTIEGSSTVRTVSTEITVPEVSLPTPAPAPTGDNSVPAPTDTAPPAPDVPATLVTSKPVPVGTGGAVLPTTSGVPVVAGAPRLGMGIAGGLLAFALAL